MLRWAFLFVMAGILIWMFSDSKQTRFVGLGLLSAVAAVAMFFFYYLDTPERREAEVLPPDQAIAEVQETSRKLETNQFALKPADIRLINAKIAPGSKKSWNNNGEQVDAPDLFSWSLSGKAQNQSEKYTVQDLILKVRLFNCPSFFDTPQAKVTQKQLTTQCSRIGQRSLGLYGLKIAPESEAELAETVRFNDQIEPRNWRYLVQVERVSTLAN